MKTIIIIVPTRTPKIGASSEIIISRGNGTETACGHCPKAGGIISGDIIANCARSGRRTPSYSGSQRFCYIMITIGFAPILALAINIIHKLAPLIPTGQMPSFGTYIQDRGAAGRRCPIVQQSVKRHYSGVVVRIVPISHIR